MRACEDEHNRCQNSLMLDPLPMSTWFRLIIWFMFEASVIPLMLFLGNLARLKFFNIWFRWAKSLIGLKEACDATVWTAAKCPATLGIWKKKSHHQQSFKIWLIPNNFLTLGLRCYVLMRPLKGWEKENSEHLVLQAISSMCGQSLFAE